MDAGAKFVMLAPVLPMVLLVVAFWQLPWTPLRLAGLVIFVGSFILLTMARINLGNSFSVTPQARQVTKHGVYSKVRHPIYVFSTLLFAGLIFYVDRPIFLLLFLVLIPVQALRARAEERVLEEKFGEEYVNYRTTTWM
ncbi:MAG: isoprenylcysteine carboxyl methyltransferase [Acidobacteriales bacterium]|nr:isoprenylcysteine carboxyl methyltransferase [Terriglobales bacterium]